MSIHCRLFAIPEADIQKLFANPAAVVGRLAMSGSPICELHDARQTISLLLSGNPGHLDGTGISLLTGGTELGVLELAGALPRLLDFREVKLLNASLQRITGIELQRRFQHQCVGSASLGPRTGETTVEWEDALFASAANAFDDDWTMDQAEGFERIATQVDALKAFIAQTTGHRDWLLIAIQDAE
jgi:hypothetical protein